MDYLTSCDSCGFECDACYVDSAWQFLCPLCERIAFLSLDSRIAPESHTSTRNASTHEYASEKMASLVAFETTIATCIALLASMEKMTARLITRA